VLPKKKKKEKKKKEDKRHMPAMPVYSIVFKKNH
jgi:hypothetical protein